MAIYQIKENGQLAEMKPQSGDSAHSLKQLLAENPSLLAGEQIDPFDPRRWLSIATQLPVTSTVYDQERGVVDHLFVDQDAMPTLVEVVTSSDHNFWELSIAKLLDYAAHGVSYWSISYLQDHFTAHWRNQGGDGEGVLKDFLAASLGADLVFDPDGKLFWQQLQENLRQGKIRLVLISDRIPAPLQQLVEFLNQQMDHAEVLAVEISQYASDSGKIIIPRLIGITPASEKKSISPRPGSQWDEAAFCQELQAREATDSLVVAQRLIEWAKSRKLHFHWGKERIDGSFSVVLKQESGSYALLTVGMSRLFNDLKIQFGVPLTTAPFEQEEKRKELLQRFPTIQGMRIVEDAQSLTCFVSSRQAEAVLDRIFHALDWILHEMLG